MDVVVTLTTCRTGFDTLWVSDSGRDFGYRMQQGYQKKIECMSFCKVERPNRLDQFVDKRTHLVENKETTDSTK